MHDAIIKNIHQLATTPERQMVLDIVEAGFNSINTERVVENAVKINEDKLSIKGHSFELKNIDHIYIIGFGKASCPAAYALEKVLGSSLKEGLAIGVTPSACEVVHTFTGTHPLPSVQNVEVCEKIVELSKKASERDLVIVVVSGGGSALLCWPMAECKQANKLYEDFLKTGGDIKELNTVRKHISMLKGGGLAKMIYPAQIVGLIFSDVPGDNYEVVASGPTYKDSSTIKDAQAILDKYHLTGYELNETPKEDKYFERLINVPMVSNLTALEAMRKKASEFGYKVKVLSSELYDDPRHVAQRFVNEIEERCILLGAGEPKTKVKNPSGRGGRCQRLALEALPLLRQTDVFAAFASDGLDNSEVAGVIEDFSTLERSKAQGLDIAKYRQAWDSLDFYEKLDQELLMTGPTGENVSDLMVMFRK